MTTNRVWEVLSKPRWRVSGFLALSGVFMLWYSSFVYMYASTGPLWIIIADSGARLTFHYALRHSPGTLILQWELFGLFQVRSGGGTYINKLLPNLWSGTGYFSVYIPVPPVTTLLCCVWFMKRRGHRTRSASIDVCRRCQYPAPTQTSERCPECGLLRCPSPPDPQQ